MLKFMQKHPFGVKAFFKQSVVLTFAFPKEILGPLIPPCLTLDTFKDQWAFVAIAFVETEKLHPAFLPDFLGNSFILTGYRIFVRYHSKAGKRLRGLYILESETNSKMMNFMGGMLTKYQYRFTDITIKNEGNRIFIESEQSGYFADVLKHENDAVKLPDQSPFESWQEARRFAGPLPFTFSYDAATQNVLIVEGVRENWKPQPLEIKNYSTGFFEKIKLGKPVLANAFIIENIPYQWKKGRIEKWHS
ncbi:DUF2071 domain-containing protein [Chitinophagaceae bacterium LY-5]|uniref:DUF2071 domain-containing protein n=2 Tax=Polluticaenibacter yanchengensis TaxID=3014562 RepID=A0ABT4UQS3_9BACT|nr:DUF2071 domain-containing protein [Chitinophagaceae bacterium LY-5]